MSTLPSVYHNANVSAKKKTHREELALVDGQVYRKDDKSELVAAPYSCVSPGCKAKALIHFARFKASVRGDHNHNIGLDHYFEKRGNQMDLNHSQLRSVIASRTLTGLSFEASTIREEPGQHQLVVSGYVYNSAHGSEGVHFCSEPGCYASAQFNGTGAFNVELIDFHNHPTQIGFVTNSLQYPETIQGRTSLNRMAKHGEDTKTGILACFKSAMPQLSTAVDQKSTKPTATVSKAPSPPSSSGLTEDDSRNKTMSSAPPLVAKRAPTAALATAASPSGRKRTRSRYEEDSDFVPTKKCKPSGPLRQSGRLRGQKITKPEGGKRQQQAKAPTATLKKKEMSNVLVKAEHCKNEANWLYNVREIYGNAVNTEVPTFSFQALPIALHLSSTAVVEGLPRPPLIDYEPPLAGQPFTLKVAIPFRERTGYRIRTLHVKYVAAEASGNDQDDSESLADILSKVRSVQEKRGPASKKLIEIGELINPALTRQLVHFKHNAGNLNGNTV